MPIRTQISTRCGGSSSSATRASRLQTDRRRPDWAAKIHIAVSPVYYHTYLYGAIVALQLAAALESELGGIVDRPEAGALLRERLFAPGESFAGTGSSSRLPGAPLSVESLEREVRTWRMTDVAPLRPRADRRGRGAQDQLPRAVLRPRLRVRVHAGDGADPRGHEPAGLRPRGARARDGVVGVVGVRVDDERDRRRERGHAADHVRGDGGRVLHGARRPRRVPGRGGLVRRRLLRRAHAELGAVRVGCPRRSRPAPRDRAALALVPHRGLRRARRAASSTPTTARGSGWRRSSSTSSAR